MAERVEAPGGTCERVDGRFGLIHTFMELPNAYMLNGGEPKRLRDYGCTEFQREKLLAPHGGVKKLFRPRKDGSHADVEVSGQLEQ